MKVLGVIVLYNEHNESVINHLISVAKQVDSLFIVDNSSDSHEELYNHISNVIYNPLYDNYGIAAAQNIAIEYAIKEKFKFIFFSDPDSNVQPGSVVKMKKTYDELLNNNILVGGIGSYAYNQDTGLPYSLENSFICDYDFNLIETTYLRNSVSLIPVSHFISCGGMDRSFFIDDVDSEWCWRVSLIVGARFFIDKRVTIQHRLGRANHKILGTYYSICSPKRLYYEYRNFIWLYRRQYVPKKWINLNIIKYVLKFFYYPLLVSPRMSNLKWILKGIKDGMKNNEPDIKLIMND